jgi:hypothetical protein
MLKNYFGYSNLKIVNIGQNTVRRRIDIAGVYFGISIISLAFLIKKLLQLYQKRRFIDSENISNFENINEVEMNRIIK